MRAFWSNVVTRLKSGFQKDKSIDTKGETGPDLAAKTSQEKETVQPGVKIDQTLKMEAVANLAGGVAHQFNNALVGISGNLELLKLDLPDNGATDKYIKPMETAIRRMTYLTTQLLAYAQGGKYQPKAISLNDLMRESLALIQQDMNPDIEVETYFSSDLSQVEVDPTQLKMVLSAVVTNAAEAIEGAGRIKIFTRDEAVDEELVRHYAGLELGPYVCLAIEDNGRGMDERTKGRVFEPFFTTKFQGRGLGMAAVYGIVQNHNGRIFIDTHSGRGTIVQIYLPAVEASGKPLEERQSVGFTDKSSFLGSEEERAAVTA